jgi:hypothetical protein
MFFLTCSWLWVGNKNLSLELVEAGFASVHFSAEKTPYFRALKIAEDNVKARRENVRINTFTRHLLEQMIHLVFFFIDLA